MRTGEPDPDLAALPDAVRAKARVFNDGEVAWPNEHAESAINALADTGKVILALDARTLLPDCRVMEIPVSAWEDSQVSHPAAAIERARREALDALSFAQAEGTHVLVTW